MPDHWGFVFAAYAVAAVALAAYWRRLVRLERDPSARAGRRQGSATAPRGGRR